MLQGDVGVTLYYTTNLSMTAAYIFFLKQTYLLSTCSRSASRSLILLCSIILRIQCFNFIIPCSEITKCEERIQNCLVIMITHKTKSITWDYFRTYCFEWCILVGNLWTAKCDL